MTAGTVNTNSSREAATLLRAWARDLSCRSADEIRAKWASREERLAIDRLDAEAGGFDGRLKDHSWLFYISTQIFFANVLGDPAFLYAPFHRDMILRPVEAYLMDEKPEEPGLFCGAQRDSLKSSIFHGSVVTGFALRRFEVYGEHSRILMSHEHATQAEGNLVRLKQRLINCRWFADVWGTDPVTGEHGFHWPVDFGTKEQFDWPNKPPGLFSESSVMARGLTADLTGLHFDLICSSDMVNKDHRYSARLRHDTEVKFSGLSFTKDTRRSWHTIDGTLYHHADQNSKIMRAKDANGKPLYRQILIGAGGKRAGAPLSLPYRHTEEFLEKKRLEIMGNDGNDDMWWLQYQNKSNATRMKAADLNWLRSCRRSDIGAEAMRLILVDPAWKGTKNSGEGNFAAIEVWAMERRGSLVLEYLMDGVYSNELSEGEGKAEIFRLMAQYFVIAVAPEERGGYGFRTSLKNEAVSRGVSIDVIELKSMQTPKPNRCSRLIGHCEAGRVFICEECDPQLKQAFIDQYEIFPQCIDEEDDALDCGAYICDPAIQEKFAPMLPPPAQPWAMYNLQPKDSRYSRYCSS